MPIGPGQSDPMERDSRPCPGSAVRAPVPPAAGNGRPRTRVPWSLPVADAPDTLFDAVGVGIGPFNLSAAALLHPLPELRTRFYEREPEFQWHPGLLFPEATIQVSYLKDLVTLADPTSSFTFLSFLHATGRLYRFINAGFPRVNRREFNQYLRWVAASLPGLCFGRGVDEVRFEHDALVVYAGGERVRTRSVILGTGLVQAVPECARRHLGATVFHAYGFLHQEGSLAGKRVAVVGGGQTGAEVVSHLLADDRALPERVLWISRRANFLPLDESPFTNEMFTPGYSDYFFGLGAPERAGLLREQKLASDGISGELLDSIYRRLYLLELVEGRTGLCSLYPRRELEALDPCRGAWTLEVNGGADGARETLHADVVVLATGAEYRVPPCLAPLDGRIPRAGDELVVRDDFSVEWDGPPELRIYLQNGARHRRGVADPNLSLMAWRSARIVNSIAGRHVYDVEEAHPLVRWAALPPQPPTGGTLDEQHHGAGAPS
ncbi:MAG TPA: SidA/IucD/PvdA family monooxygenase [Longimicrobiaceae bacterium]|nr:SidA/IucD/PvdA family monooxygenase [Longimicrobiaceae bacterium]